MASSLPIDPVACLDYLPVMAVREIITVPDPLLRKTSFPVEKIDDDVRTLLDDMLETMYEAPGVGLAAIQVAVPKRIVVCDVSKDESAKHPICLVNPEITWVSEDIAVYEEGCLSIPEQYAEVERPAACRVRYLDRDGATQELEADGLLATCLQHEIDHLNGILFIDHLSRLKRELLTRKYTKAQKRKAAG